MDDLAFLPKSTTRGIDSGHIFDSFCVPYGIDSGHTLYSCYMFASILGNRFRAMTIFGEPQAASGEGASRERGEAGGAATEQRSNRLDGYFNPLVPIL